MTTARLLLLCSWSLAIFPPSDLPADDWPWWRGPDRNGVASPDQDPPTSLQDPDVIGWSVELPGRSHGSAIVVADQVVVAAAESSPQRQSLLCFNREDGAPLWTARLHEGGQVRMART